MFYYQFIMCFILVYLRLLSYLLLTIPVSQLRAKHPSSPWILPVFSGPLIISTKCMSELPPGRLWFLLHLCRRLPNSLHCQSFICNFRAHISVCLSRFSPYATWRTCLSVLALLHPPAVTATGGCFIWRSIVPLLLLLDISNPCSVFPIPQ